MVCVVWLLLVDEDAREVGNGGEMDVSECG